MIIFRGLGLLGFFTVAAGMGLVSLFTNPNQPVGRVLGGLLAGALTYALGWYLNVYRGRAKAEAYAQRRRAEVAQAAQLGVDAAGGTVTGHGSAQLAGSLDEAYQAELAHARKALSRAHSVFFVPLQWLGIGAGAAIVISGFFL
ncbi:hypothetical protein [Buchananella hordeovulneris]|uniref:hypothetical protein n=1 Tax=Buchananella hordeovulneris TaxID=52770 RepID=UPI000F5EA374|nr:hypothetical protein [Buchananella hordeovulneris]RRD43002.1 hypothetical protein EII13_08170 [Buchananella hordeovulneris]RRD51675.1 hypothetical protein EII12_07850 [Buchananella hordeovulneris]